MKAEPKKILEALRDSLSDKPDPKAVEYLKEVEEQNQPSEVRELGGLTENKKTTKIPKWIKGNPHADKRIPDND